MLLGRLVIVSGSPGAGKSSVARELASGSSQSTAVYLHSDDFYANIAKGFIAPWLVEADAQNRAVVAAIVAAAASYAGGGFEVAVDGVFGPWFLEPWRALVRDGFDVHYVVLRPDEATTVARGTARRSVGALVDPAVIAQMWRQFSDLGALESHAIDTTTCTLEETVARVRDAVKAGTKRLTRVG
jgi:chloramphenicol 3-O-phosphotransferase